MADDIEARRKELHAKARESLKTYNAECSSSQPLPNRSMEATMLVSRCAEFQKTYQEAEKAMKTFDKDNPPKS